MGGGTGSRSRPFVGRAAELDVLARHLAGAGSGRTHTLAVSGEAGIGKTRLIDEFLRTVPHDVRVLRSGCVDFGAVGMPFGVFVGLLRQVLGQSAADELPPGFDTALAALVPGLSVVVPPTAWPPDQLGRARLFGLALGLFQRLAELGPVVVVLEDVQWADATSLDLLRFLLPSLADSPVLFLVTCRSHALGHRHPVAHVLAGLAPSAEVEVLRLEPLSPDDLVTIVQPVVDDAATAARIAERADGNAFFAEELAAAAQEGELLPGRLRDVLLARFAALSQDVQLLLRVTALVGRPAPDELLERLCELPPDRFISALHVAADQQLLVVLPGDAWQFRHGLLQQAVLSDLLPVERRTMHTAIAQALDASLGAGAQVSLTTAGELAHHWSQAGRPVEAFWAVLRAARLSLTVHAFKEAEAHYRHVVDLLPALPQGDLAAPPLPVLLEAAEAARRAGHTDRAVALVQEAAGLLGDAGGPADHAAVLERLGQCQWEAGRTDQAREAYDEAVRLLEAEPASELRARVLAASARVLMVSDEFEASAQLCEQAVAIARASGAPDAARSALITSGVDQVMTGNVEHGLQTLRDACTAASGSARLDDLVRAYGNLAAMLSRAGRPAEARDAALEGLDHLSAQRIPLSCAGLLAVNAVSALVWLGQWDDAVRLAQQALESEVPALHAAFLRQALAEVATGRGDVTLAEQHVAAVGQLATDIAESQFITSFSTAVAELKVWQGDHPAARDVVADGLKRTQGQQEDVVVLLCAVGLRAEADEAERRRWRRNDVADLADYAAELMAAASAAALAARGAAREQAAPGLAQCRAELRRLERRSDPGLWREAAAGWLACGRLPQSAYARYREAEAWTEQRDSRRAREALALALEATRRVGASALEAEIHALARRARLEVADRPDLPGPAPADGGVTGRELEVLELLVAGATNREIGRTLFISEKTAGVHVSHILAKLQARNRVEAAAAARRLGLVDRGVARTTLTSEERA